MKGTHLSLVTLCGVTFVIYANVMEAIFRELYGGSMQVLESGVAAAMLYRFSTSKLFSELPYPISPCSFHLKTDYRDLYWPMAGNFLEPRQREQQVFIRI